MFGTTFDSSFRITRVNAVESKGDDVKATLLAVDDDPIILDTYQAILEPAYNLHLMSSAREALNFLYAHPRIDLVLLDIIMPEIDGYEICRRIRANLLFADLKVIMVSSKTMLDDKLLGYEIGADDYISKPFQASELLAKVKVFVRLKNVEEINRVKTNLINLLYHETRTPLTSILGYAGLLEESGQLDSEGKYFVERIRQCGDMLLRCCERTMLLSDLKAGNIPIEKNHVPLSLFLADRQSFAKRMSERKCDVQIHSEEGLWIDADPKLFAIAVDTLVDNAVKFANRGTVVEVSTKATNGQIVIEVANEGLKITPGREEEIFNEFSIEDVSHHHQGQGLSLAIARRIVEAHEGTLTVTNHVKGPAFVIALKA